MCLINSPSRESVHCLEVQGLLLVVCLGTVAEAEGCEMEELRVDMALGSPWAEELGSRLGDPKLAIVLEVLVAFFCRRRWDLLQPMVGFAELSPTGYEAERQVSAVEGE